MADSVTNRGYFSVLRWCTDPTREEARNVAVVLVDAAGQFGGVMAAPLSQISPRLHEQGILDTMVVNLQRQFDLDHKPTLGMLQELHLSMRHSLSFTPPKQTAVPDVDLALGALYNAFVKPRGGGPSRLTKGRLLDRVVGELRNDGVEVRRGTYVEDFLLDAVIERADGPPAAVDVLSFATTAQKWAPVEHDAGHFLFALERTQLPGMAVIAPPTDASHQTAHAAYERVCRWFDGASVVVADPDGLVKTLNSIA